MSSFRPARRRWALLCTAAALAGCHGPAPIEATVEFQTERGVVRGVSTEAGILALPEVVPTTGELSFRYRVGNGFFDDVAALQRKSDSLALLIPKSSKLNLARFAAWPAAFDDRLYLEVRAGPATEDGAALLRCRLLDDGRRGDLLVVDEGRVADVAQHYAGAGLFAWRDGTMELVGILNGVYCEEAGALAFIGLDEMDALLPAESPIVARRITVRRADFEYGVPRDFQGERPAVSDPPITELKPPRSRQ